MGLRELAGLKEPGGPVVSPGLQQLRYLGLQRNGTIDDNGLFYIQQGLRNLVTLNLRMCFNVTDDGIRHVAGVETLRSLVLYRCKNLTAASIQHLAARTSSLRHLDIGCCTNIDDSALLNTSCGPGLVGLVSLKMMANLITDRGLSALSKALVNLEFLDVSDCKRITKNGIAHDVWPFAEVTSHENAILHVTQAWHHPTAGSDAYAGNR
ncbi:hypothetical protein HPB48_016540 [Haemaphysalis longicornis]|uniref:F-box/LRR-repeat protein 15-like leucin rich repeat domain-containing protein n=1 Tax=Haemaphysalis longicornis TaxID=44386 RepID=A0A9J6GEK4_HAELO|nr:hypothetical protein HPB48_016540 [Haemaphysalis longicornis]